MLGLGALLGTVASAVGAIGAGKAQKRGINEALEAQRESIAELEPWQQAGEEALGAWSEKVMAGPGKFEESEEYKFIRGEGEKAIKRGASTSAGFGTGAMGKSLIRYGQGIASTYYDKFQDRYLKSLAPYQQLAGVGERAVGQRTNIRDRMAGLQQDKGTVKANVYAGVTGAVRGGIGDITTLSQLGGGGGGTSIPSQYATSPNADVFRQNLGPGSSTYGRRPL